MKYSQYELSAIAMGRTNYPDMSQRELAATLYRRRGVVSIGGNGINTDRTQASIYGALRRYDQSRTPATASR